MCLHWNWSEKYWRLICVCMCACVGEHALIQTHQNRMANYAKIKQFWKNAKLGSHKTKKIRWKSTIHSPHAARAIIKHTCNSNYVLYPSSLLCMLFVMIIFFYFYMYAKLFSGHFRAKIEGFLKLFAFLWISTLQNMNKILHSYQVHQKSDSVSIIWDLSHENSWCWYFSCLHLSRKILITRVIYERLEVIEFSYVAHDFQEFMKSFGWLWFLLPFHITSVHSNKKNGWKLTKFKCQDNSKR